MIISIKTTQVVAESIQRDQRRKMEDEIKNFIKVCITVLASLTYCYCIPRRIPPGKLRLLSLLPIITIFTLLPLSFSSLHLTSITGFFLPWLANFKLLLFAFNQGPLSSSNPTLSLPRFISVACLPIKIKQNPAKKPSNSSLSYVIKFLFFAVIIQFYDYKQHIHPAVLLFFYCFHLYFSLEILLAVAAVSAQSILGLELEPQFDEPYLSTSLQDFWGKRWNLIVSSILRPTVYQPVRRVFSPWIGQRWAMICAVFTTFVVSGLMHELHFYYMGRRRPTGEVMWFFVLHGACLAVEIVVKKCLNGRWRLHPVVSRPLTVGFVVVTGSWLFFPQFLKCEADARAIREYGLAIEFARDVGRVVKEGLVRIGMLRV